LLVEEEEAAQKRLLLYTLATLYFKYLANLFIV